MSDYNHLTGTSAHAPQCPRSRTLRWAHLFFTPNTKKFPYREDIEAEPTFNEMFEKISVLLDYSTVLSEEFVAVHNDNLRTAPIMTDRHFEVCSKLEKYHWDRFRRRK
ncbi:hypothetical protein TNCV_2981001 [Trichonephila clavipes]|nr:hypothetical protein TNCV_2981001 [Trichonephila clavipes]